MIKAGVICGSSGTQGARPFLQDCSDKECWKGAIHRATQRLEQKGPRDPPPPPSSCPEHSKLPSSSPGSGQGRCGDGDGTAPPDAPRPSITEPFSQGKFSRAQLALRLPHLVTIASRPVDPIEQQTQGLMKLNPQQALRENHPTRG